MGKEIEAYPELLDVVKSAGVTDIWCIGFSYGYWVQPFDDLKVTLEAIRMKGLNANIINLPLGHPGESIGAEGDDYPLIPPPHWKSALSVDGKKWYGTSIHEPAASENIQALQTLSEIGIKNVFLDDDFRLARSPNQIGGCFCREHICAFMRKYGYDEKMVEQLFDDINNRKFSPVLTDWVDFISDELTDFFRVMQNAAGDIRLGTMVMYMGSEKSGIRLHDYADVPVRVGECMFSDESFGSVKGKTNELFSVLFHRRFISPDNAFSETTTFPATALSVGNMVAKLAIPVLADVRNTMFMSGATIFPISYWDTLKPALRKQAEMRDKIAGHRPVGPLKHYWGRASRYVGDANPYSLFLAMGIPFEVIDTISDDGWIFMSDSDAVELDNIKNTQAEFVYRPTAKISSSVGIPVDESFDSLMELKKKIIQKIGDTGIPYVEDNLPIVCSWYPEIHTVALWNLSESRHTFTLNTGSRKIPVALEGLDIQIVEM